MRRNFKAYTFLPSYSRNEAPLINFLISLPVIGAQVWACSIGWLIAMQLHNLSLGILCGFGCTVILQTRWSEIPFAEEGWNLAALSVSGIISSLALYLAQSYPALALLGWCCTGVLNLRFYRWFAGQPVVFENRGLGELLTFLLGPIYWAFLLLLAVFVIVLSPLLQGNDTASGGNSK